MQVPTGAFRAARSPFVPEAFPDTACRRADARRQPPLRVSWAGTSGCVRATIPVRPAASGEK